MNILLIEPPYERFIGFKSEWFPMGLAYIAAYLEARGHHTAVYHAEHGRETEYKSPTGYADNFHRYKQAIESGDHPIWKEVREEITLFRPDVVGISALTPKIPSAYKIAGICKETNPDIKVVFGNHHATVRPDEIMANHSVDFVIRGEGEKAFHSLMEILSQSSNDFRSVAGLSFRENGRIISNEPGPLIENLDDLPFPARERLLNLETFTPDQLSMVMTSRGCPYRCGFCASYNMWGKRVRFRSIENILAEISELKKRYAVRNIVFMDDSFTVSRKRVSEICTALIEQKIDITWSCLTRVNMISDDIVRLMKKAGCTKVDIGIESGNQRVLNLIQKDIILGQIRSAAEILRRQDMFWSGFFMFGFPTETEEEVFDTLRFLYELKPDWANISIFTPYPGTALFNLSLEKGITTVTPDYALYSHQNTASRFSDTIPKERFHVLANQVLSEVHRYNRSCRSLLKRAVTRNYHKNPGLLLRDIRKVATWLKK
jgi:anaerobic magnesium-protoporphyrin IX monomethyl ester cyclase